MDTKTLYDAATKAGISFRNTDGIRQDCLDCWVNEALGNKEFMGDSLLDFLQELFADTPHSTMYLRNILTDLPKVFKEERDILANHLTPSIRMSCAQIITGELANIGRAFAYIIELETRKHIEDLVDDWVLDCQGYFMDMEQGQREDAAYARSRP
jgi:hypothetical protein